MKRVSRSNPSLQCSVCGQWKRLHGKDENGYAVQRFYACCGENGEFEHEKEVCDECCKKNCPYKNKNMKNLTKDEKSLLLFFETAYVDHAGKLNPQHMNEDDRKIAAKWSESGYVKFGRVRMSDITSEKTMYAFLSEEAMNDAHEERKARARRMQLARKWQTTEEKNSCPTK